MCIQREISSRKDKFLAQDRKGINLSNPLLRRKPSLAILPVLVFLQIFPIFINSHHSSFHRSTVPHFLHLSSSIVVCALPRTPPPNNTPTKLQIEFYCSSYVLSIHCDCHVWSSGEKSMSSAPAKLRQRYKCRRQRVIDLSTTDEKKSKELRE